MKISKIKNSRPGISVTENKNEEQLSRQSLLYYAPVKDGKIRLESKDLEQHVTECNEKAQKLYNVITPEINFYRDENRQKMVENLARNFNAVINNALRSIRNPKEKKERRVEKEVAFILNLSKKSIKMKKDVFVKSTDLIVKFPENNKYNKKNDKGTGSKESINKIDLLMKKVGVTVNDRPVVKAALEKENITGTPCCAIELNDGRIITGKTGNLLGSSAAALLNALKALGDLDDSIDLISSSVIEPIQKLKVEYMKIKKFR